MAEIALRIATQDDSDNLFAWRNDPETRNNSKSTEPVPHEDHVRWLSASLTNPDRRLLIGTEDGKGIGTARLDRVADGYIVSITIAPEARRRGCGKALLEATCASTSPNRLYAEIKDLNEASRRIFNACGFQLVGPTDEPGLSLYRRD